MRRRHLFIPEQERWTGG